MSVLVLIAAVCVFISLPGLEALAALEPGTDFTRPPQLRQWNMAQSVAPPASPQSGAVVPPVKREAPQTPPAAAAPAQPPPPAAEVKPAAAPEAKKPEPQPKAASKETAPEESPGVLGTIQDWLARANREYQGVVVKELSLPPPAPPANAKADDEIAKKLKDQQAEEARKVNDAKRQEDAARKQAEDKAAAEAKAREVQKLDEDRKKAEETKRLADEAKKKADEIFKSENEKKPEPKKPEVAAPVVPVAKPEVAAPVAPAVPKQDDATARAAEQKRLEAQHAAEEAKKQEQLKLEQQRRAEAARQQEEQRRQAEAAAKAEAKAKAEAAAKEDNARRRAADVAATEKNRARRVVVIPEPIVRPVDPGTSFRPEMSAERKNRSTDESLAEATSAPEPTGRFRRRHLRIYAERTYRGINVAAYHRGTAVKRWVRRDNGSGCSRAGQRINPPARYTIARGDSLWRISEKHYNEGRKYPKIYRANRSSISDPDLIYPCQRVLVPR